MTALDYGFDQTPTAAPVSHLQPAEQRHAEIKRGNWWMIERKFKRRRQRKEGKRPHLRRFG